MNTLFSSKQIGLSAACALALSFAFGPTLAADFAPGSEIWKNTDGEWCWNREFTSVTAPSGCGLQQPLAQYVAPAPAPASVPAAYVQPARTQPAPVAVLSERPPKKDRN